MVTQAGLKLLILLPQPPESRDYTLQCPASPSFDIGCHSQAKEHSRLKTSSWGGRGGRGDRISERQPGRLSLHV